MASSSSSSPTALQGFLSFLRTLTPPQLLPEIERRVSGLWEKPPVKGLELALQRPLTVDSARAFLFSPSTDGNGSDEAARSYGKALLTRPPAGLTEEAMIAHPLTKAHISMLAVLYLHHCHQWPSFCVPFVEGGGLEGLASFLRHPIRYLRGQAMDSIIRLTSHERFSWFEAAQTEQERRLHAAMLALGGSNERKHKDSPPFLSVLMSNWVSSFPNESFSSLQLLAFWLSWARKLYGQPLRVPPSPGEKVASAVAAAGAGDSDEEASFERFLFISKAMLRRLELWSQREVVASSSSSSAEAEEGLYLPPLPPSSSSSPEDSKEPLSLADARKAVAYFEGRMASASSGEENENEAETQHMLKALPPISGEEKDLAKRLFEDFSRFPTAEEAMSDNGRKNGGGVGCSVAGIEAKLMQPQMTDNDETGEGGNSKGGEGKAIAAAPATAATDSAASIVASAGKHKDAGNLAFTKGNWAVAARSYSQALAICKPLMQRLAAISSPPSPAPSLPPLDAAATKLLVDLHANRAAAVLRLLGVDDDGIPPPSVLLLLLSGTAAAAGRTGQPLIRVLQRAGGEGQGQGQAVTASVSVSAVALTDAIKDRLLASSSTSTATTQQRQREKEEEEEEQQAEAAVIGSVHGDSMLQSAAFSAVAPPPSPSSSAAAVAESVVMRAAAVSHLFLAVGQDCDFALMLQATNIKALYRKAQALCGLRKFSEALSVADACLTLLREEASSSGSSVKGKEPATSSLSPAMTSQLYSRLTAFTLKVAALKQAEQESRSSGDRKEKDKGKGTEERHKTEEKQEEEEEESLLTQSYSKTNPPVLKASSQSSIEDSILQALLMGNSQEYGVSSTSSVSSSSAAVESPSVPRPVPAAPAAPEKEKEKEHVKAAPAPAPAPAPAKKVDLDALLGGRTIAASSTSGGSSGGGGQKKKDGAERAELPAYMRAMLGK